ncbi:MAG: hypothetical protein R2864_07300 [Syntrophotaleaceae bacterium]
MLLIPLAALVLWLGLYPETFRNTAGSGPAVAQRRRLAAPGGRVAVDRTGTDRLLPLLILALGATALLLAACGAIGAAPPNAGAGLALSAALCAGLLPSSVMEVGGMAAPPLCSLLCRPLWSLATAGTLISSGRHLARRHLPSGEYSACCFCRRRHGPNISAASLSTCF